MGIIYRISKWFGIFILDHFFVKINSLVKEKSEYAYMVNYNFNNGWGSVWY